MWVGLGRRDYYLVFLTKSEISHSGHLENTSYSGHLRKVLRFDTNWLYLHSTKYELYLVLCKFWREKI